MVTLSAFLSHWLLLGVYQTFMYLQTAQSPKLESLQLY